MTTTSGEDARFTITSEEALVDGSRYAHDHVANAGYANVSPTMLSCRVGRTQDIGDGIHLDYSDDGDLFGIERIGGPVDRWVLMRVVRHLAETVPSCEEQP